mgnify:CR=1 FL=1
MKKEEIVPYLNSLNTLQIIEDSTFRRLLDKEIEDVINERENRPNPPKGFKFKRDWYDRLDPGRYTFQKLVYTNLNDVWIKKSSLSHELRSLVSYIGDQALTKWVTTKYNELLAESEKEELLKETVETPKVKKPRKTTPKKKKDEQAHSEGDTPNN